jgi:hypothetical protein
MVSKYPQYVLESNVIPTYSRVISFKLVPPSYLATLILSDIPPQAQFFLLRATTGFATGIALANQRQSLTESDLDRAKQITCSSYPKCGAMLGQNLVTFDKEYELAIKAKYSLK